MTRVGARVVVTRNDATPYEIDHPRLAELFKAPEPVSEAAATVNALNLAANADRAQAVTDAVVVAAADTAGGDTPEKLHDGSEHAAFTVRVSPSLHVASVDTPAGLAEPAPMRAKAADTSQRSSPISLFVSRKEGKLFVRRGFAPLFDTPITIAHPEIPLGTHVFTANRPTDGSVGLRWLAVSIGFDHAATDPAPLRGKRYARHDELPAPATREALRQAAADALDRIELPPEALDRIVPLVAPGASLLISDQGLGDETGRDTDFIVVTK